MYDYIEDLYLFTATCLKWQNFLKDDQLKLFVINSLEFYVKNSICNIYGFVIMPNHLHIVLSIAKDKTTYFQLSFLKFTSQKIIRQVKKNNPKMMELMKTDLKDRKFHFWEQNSNWRSIHSTDGVHRVLRYVHFNPLQSKWNLVQHPEDYMASSALSYILNKPLFPCLKLYHHL